MQHSNLQNALSLWIHSDIFLFSFFIQQVQPPPMFMLSTASLPSLTISLLSRSSLITALFALHVGSNCCALKAAWAGILSQIHRTAAAFSRSACFHNPSDLLLLSVPLSITALTNALFVPVSFHSLDVCIAICVLPHCSPQHGLLIEKKIVFFLSLLQTVPLS